MHAIIPDTVNGTLILSVIDFFLSFVIIAGIGLLLSQFPLLNRIPFLRGELAGVPGGASAEAARANSSAEAQPMTINEKHLMAISAAVYAVAGPHRIVHIEAKDPSSGTSSRA